MITKTKNQITYLAIGIITGIALAYAYTKLKKE